METTWNNQQGSRDRKAWLLVSTADAVTAFSGEHIPGKVGVLGEDREKAGKWSNSTFRLKVADGVRLIAGHDGWETGTFAEGLASAVGVKPPTNWAEMAAALGVSVDAAKAVLKSWRQKAAAKLDAAEAAVAGLGKPVVTGPAELPIDRFVNLTPHTVKIVGGDGRVKALLPPSGMVARVEQTRVQAGHTGAYGGVECWRTSYGEVTGLPPEQARNGLIVSAMVRTACSGRRDLFSPGELVRDADGNVTGCRGLDGNL